jgi:hypothetical protein
LPYSTENSGEPGDAKLKEPKSLQTATPLFEEVVKSAQDAAVLVLVYCRMTGHLPLQEFCSNAPV